MSELPPEIIERMRIHRSQSIDEDGPYESGDHDFENDALTIIDAYIAENDPTPIRMEWLKEIGATEILADKFFFTLPGFNLEFLGGETGLVEISASHMRENWITITTVGEFRTFCRLFRIEVKA